MSFRKTTKTLLSTVDTTASAIEEAAGMATDYIKHERTKQQAVYAQELESKLYLKRAKAEELAELSELLANVSDDVKAVLTDM